MPKRNDAIEVYAINAFCEKFNASVIERPNPPEAIVEYRDGMSKTWLEVTTLWEDCGQKKQRDFARALSNPNLGLQLQGVSSASSETLAHKLKCSQKF